MYSPERDLIVPLLKREHYEAYFSFVDLTHLKDSHKELHYVYQAIKGLREEYPEKDFDVNTLQAYFFLKYPDADKEIYGNLFKTLSELVLEEDVAVGLLKAIKRRQAALKLSESALRFATGHGTQEAVLELAKFLEEGDTELEEEIESVTDDLESILANTVQKPGLRWRLECLNKSLGSLRRGNFGFLFARPETGKTTFLASECSYMLSQLKDGGGPVIWFNNEQQGEEVMLRVYQGYFGVTLEQLKANPKKYRLPASKFRLIDDANMGKAQVERILKVLKPSLVIFDQIDKIKGFAADREDLKLGAIYIWARELAKQYCPVIGVCQADGTAENQKWLTMEHVSNAKTSKQAEADWILGIGKIHAEGAEFIRYLNISKNKLLGDEDTLNDLRHGRFEVYMEQDRARYKDIVKYS